MTLTIFGSVFQLRIARNGWELSKSALESVLFKFYAYSTWERSFRKLQSIWFDILRLIQLMMSLVPHRFGWNAFIVIIINKQNSETN